MAGARKQHTHASLEAYTSDEISYAMALATPAERAHALHEVFSAADEVERIALYGAVSIILARCPGIPVHPDNIPVAAGSA